MQKKQLVWKNQYNYLLIITLLFFTLDCMIAQTTPGIDRNILISTPFFVFSFFSVFYTHRNFFHLLIKENFVDYLNIIFSFILLF